MKPSVQTTTVAASARGRQNVAATVTSIAVRVPGTGPGNRAILPAIHYDG